MLNNLLISSDVSALLADFVTGWQAQAPQRAEQAMHEAIQTALAPLAETSRLSYEQWWAVLESLQTLFEIPAIGLRIGEHVKVEHFGCLGYLFKTSLDLEQALRCFERFQRLLYDGNRASLSIDPDGPHGPEAKLVWASDYGYSNQLSDEVLISGLLNLLQTLLADDAIRPLRIEFTNTVSDTTLALYQTYFNCDIQLNQPNVSVVFPAHYFRRPIQGGDEHLHRLISRQAENLLTQVPHADARSEPLSLQVRKVLVRALQQGTPTVETIAEQFHLSPRSLHRRLNQEGVVFRVLLKETRMTLARQYLTDGKMSLPEVALMLGYSEQSAFNRAFREWFGQSPRQFQKA